jgi:hypothetical protein
MCVSNLNVSKHLTKFVLIGNIEETMYKTVQCEIGGSRSSVDAHSGFLEYDTMSIGKQLTTFERSLLPSFSG